MSRHPHRRVNVPWCARGARSNGDVVIGDDDGVVTVRRADAAAVLAAAKQREDKEARSRERYQRGELSLDVNDMRAELTRAGLRYVQYGTTTRDHRHPRALHHRAAGSPAVP